MVNYKTSIFVIRKFRRTDMPVLFNWKINMNKLLRNLMFFLFLILSSCCIEEDLLRNEREDYLGDELRIDGLYYYLLEGEIRGITFLYRNGICFEIFGDGTKRYNPEEIKTLLTEKHIGYHINDKSSWGIFHVAGNSFFMEKWATPLDRNRSTFIESGHILDGTSFLITKIDDSHSGVKEVNRIYYFYPYSPKPDSTNKFIK